MNSTHPCSSTVTLLCSQPRIEAFIVPECALYSLDSKCHANAVLLWSCIATKVPFGLMMTRFLKLQLHFLFSGTFSTLDSSLQSYGCEIYDQHGIPFLKRSYMQLFIADCHRRKQCPCYFVLRPLIILSHFGNVLKHSLIAVLQVKVRNKYRCLSLLFDPRLCN